MNNIYSLRIYDTELMRFSMEKTTKNLIVR